jgi:hypothetical protein
VRAFLEHFVGLIRARHPRADAADRHAPFSADQGGAGGPRLYPKSDFNGADTLTFATSDGTATATDTIAITVGEAG